MAKRESVLEVVHKTARGLRAAGLVDVRTMREFDALCLPPVKEYSAREIKRIRERNKVSQAVFAAYSTPSVSTVQKWGNRREKAARSITPAAESGCHEVCKH